MSKIEDLIVSMKFDNKQFEAGVKVSMMTINALKNSLNFGGASKGLDEVQAAASRFSMGSMGSAVEGISAKFLALSTVAVTALTNITNKAVDAGLSMAKSLTLDPIMDGFAEYELKMGSIQTILANTSKHGTTLQDVTANLDELNTYADKTIYNFGDMTRNIGLFTNAGIKVEDATKMIQGFSNEAAASGTTASAAAGAAYQLSQGLSAGVLTAQDWISLTNVGMGNANMKDGIIQIAEAMGAFEGTGVTANEAAKDFKGTLEKKWLRADIMENYLKIQAEGNKEVSRAMMEQIGLNDEQIEAFQRQQETAEDSATKVRTWTQLIGTLREGVGSSWAQTFDILLGDFDAATKLFTGIYDTLGPMIDSFGDARNRLLGAWATLGGREILLDGLHNVFKSLLSILGPVAEGFRQIFPPMTLATIINATEAFQRFTQGLIVGSETGDKIKRTFAGVFAIFGIGWEVVKGVFSAFLQLFSGVQSGAGGFLSLTAAIGDWLVAAHQAIKNGDGLSSIFGTLGTILTIPIKLLSGLSGMLGGLISGLGQLGSVASQVFSILASGDFKSGFFEEDSPIIDILFKIREAFGVAGEAVQEFFSGLGDAFSPANLSMLLGAGGAVAIGVALRKIVKDGISFGVKGSDGLFESLTGMFDGITGTLESVTGIFDGLTGALTTMQNNLKANILLKIAAAVGILAAAIKLLSTIDGAALATSLGAITVAFGQLLGAMAILARVAGSAGFLAIPSLASAMVSLSIAVLIMATAVKTLSDLSWEELAKGLLGVAGSLAVMVVGAMGLSKVQGSIVRTAIALIPLAIALKILASAVKDFAGMSWGEMAQGIVGVGGALVVIAGALRIMPDTMVSTGAGLILVGAGLKIIASAVGTFSGMSWGEMAQGMVGLGGSLVLIAGALRLMPPNMAVMGVGLALVSVAIAGISAAVQAMGGMGWEELIRGLVGLGGSLGILAVALTFMNSTLAGSAALMLAAGAIAMLVPPLIMLGSLSWADLIQGLVGLAGVLAVLGVAGVLLTPVVPTLLGLGAAMALLGVGLGAIGLGAQAFVAAMSMFVSLIDKSKNSLIGLMDLIPLMAAQLAAGIIAFATTISANAGEFVGAFKNLIIALLDAIIEIAPKIGEALSTLLLTLVNIIITNAPAIGAAVTVLIQTFLNTVVTNAPRIVDSIFQVMIRFLQTIRDRVPEIVTAATDLIVAFINAVAANLPRITESAFNLIITFINGLTNTINNNSERMRQAGLDLAMAIVDGIIGGLGSAVQRVANKAAELARGALNAAKEALGINSPSKEFIKVGGFVGDGLVIGLDNSNTVVGRRAYALGESVLGGAKAGLSGVEQIFSDISDAGTQAWDQLSRGYIVGGSPVADGLLNLRSGFEGVSLAAEEATGILTKGDYRGLMWEEDSPIVDGLFRMREGFLDVTKTAESAWNILTKGDYTGGIFEEDSPIVDGLFRIREAFGPNIADDFLGIGTNAIEGFVQGIEDGQREIHDQIANMSQGAIDTARRVLGIHSPSREFEKIGEYSVDGMVKGTSNGAPKAKAAGANLATNLMMGFTTGVGKALPKALDSIFNTLESGTADAKFWGPNSPATMQLLGMHGALKEVNLQMAEFYGEVNRADPESMAAYTEKVGDNLTHLTGLFAGLEEAATTAFGMLADGAGLDKVIGSTDVLSQILNAVLTLLPGVEAAAISIGLAIVDGLLSTFIGPGTTVLGIIGDFLSGAVRWVGGLFGIKFPVEEEVKKGEEAVEDFLVTVEGGHGRFQKLTEEGIAALTDTLSNVDDLLKMDESPRITPVLDLTQFNKDHSKMLSTLEPPVDISVNTSNAQASGVYNMQQDIKSAQSDSAESAAQVTKIEYTQYNTSPKALSHVEIYRQTKSQLSLTKEALKVT